MEKEYTAQPLASRSARRLGRIEEMAERLNIPTMKAYPVAQNMPAGIRVMVGRRVRIDMDKLEEWIAKGGTL